MMSLGQPQQSSALFDNVENITIHGGNYHHSIQNFSISNEPGEQQYLGLFDDPSPFVKGLSLLRQAASLPAIHDSSDRDPPPRCAEGTRGQYVVFINKSLASCNCLTGLINKTRQHQGHLQLLIPTTSST